MKSSGSPATKSRGRLITEIIVLCACAGTAAALWLTRIRENQTLTTANITQLSEIIKREPTNATAYVYLGLRNEESQKIDEAKVAYKKASELDGDNEDAWLGWARMAITTGDIQEAFSILNVFLKSHPDNVNALLSLASFYHDQDAIRRAYETAQQATKVDSKNVRAWRRLATEANALQMYTEAETAILKALALTPDDWRSYLLLGTIQNNLRRTDDALQSLQKCVSLAPKESAPLRELGKIQINQTQDASSLKAAETSLLKAQELNPQDPEIELLLGKVYIRQERWPDAKKQLEGVVAQLSNEPEPFFELAKVYAHLGDKVQEQKARAQHSKLKEYQDKRYNLQSLIYQDNSDVEKNNSRRLELARLFVQNGEFDLAVREYTHLLARIPQDSVVQKELTTARELSVRAKSASIDIAKQSVEQLLQAGDNAMEQQQYPLAKRLYAEALVKDRKRATGYLGLGQAFLAEGNDSDAFRAFQKALALDPNMADAEFALAGIYLNMGFGDEAIRHLEPIVKKHPDKAPYHNLLGLGYQQVEVFGMAEQEFAKAVAADPNVVDYQVNLAIMEAKNGKNIEAERHFRDAATRAPENGKLLAFFGSFLQDQATARKDQTLSKEAEEVLKKSLSLVPQNYTAAFALGNLYLNQNDPRNAVTYLAMANASRPDIISTWYRLSVAYGRLNDRVKAEYYQKEFHRRQEYADRKNSTEMLARERIKDPELRLKLARIYAEGGDYERAINQYQMCLSLSPKNTIARNELTRLITTLTKQGKAPRIDSFQGMISASLAMKRQGQGNPNIKTPATQTR